MMVNDYLVNITGWLVGGKDPPFCSWVNPLFLWHFTTTGWWYTYHLEKYESQLG